MKDHPLVYIYWLDANYQEGEQDIEKLDWKCELHYVGYLIKEDDNAVTLSLERPHEGKTRNTFSILKRNILEMRVAPFAKAFPVVRVRKKKEAVVNKELAVVADVVEP